MQLPIARKLLALLLIPGALVVGAGVEIFSGFVPPPSYSAGTPGALKGEIVFKHTGKKTPEVQPYLDGAPTDSTFQNAGNLSVKSVTIKAPHDYHFEVVKTKERFPKTGEKQFTFHDKSDRKAVLALEID